MKNASGNSNLSSSENTISPEPSTENKRSFADYFWPIYKSELSKFIFLTLLMFCILGIQNLIRAMKDSVINTMIGTETISFLKFWGVLPAAFLFTLLYIRLVNVMRGERIFYLIISIFLAFFALFAFYLFPNHELIHLSDTKTAELTANHPHLKWFILIFSKWSFSLFYIVAEIWPSAVFALLFWQFVNKITSVEQSKRFYPLFSVFGQTGLILSGLFLERISSVNQFFIDLLGIQEETSVVTVKIVFSIVLILGLIGIFCFWFLNHYILDQEDVANVKFNAKAQKLSMRDSFKMVIQSRYIRLITILLLAYGLAINLVEGPWKYSAKQIYPSTTEYAAFIGGYLKNTGIFTIIFALICSNIVRKINWLAAAIITPILLMSTGIAFFVIFNFDKIGASMVIFFALTDPLTLAVAIGAIQNILSKSAKYSLFDATKEMSYVPLDNELKTRGKAAADMIGTKLGKASSAFIQSLIFILIPSATMQSISPFLMYIFIAICVLWLWGVLELNKEYKHACRASNESN